MSETKDDPRRNGDAIVDAMIDGENIDTIPPERWSLIIKQAIERAERFMTSEPSTPGGMLIGSAIIQLIVQRASQTTGEEAELICRRVIDQIRDDEFRKRINAAARHVITSQASLKVKN